jgi:hypothetical protein
MRTYLLSGETLKSIGQGALGAITFSAYNRYSTNKLMELHMEQLRLQNKYYIDKQEIRHKAELKELTERFSRQPKQFSEI